MADNVELDSGSGGAQIAADEITSVHYQRVKLIEGADGVNDGDISSANPLPVELTDADGTAAADLTAIKTAAQVLDNIVAGTEAQVDVVTSALPTGAATETTLAAIKTAAEILDNIVSGTEAQVDVVTSALPTGAATEATLADVRTAAQLLDNIVSGTEAQVDVVTSALPTGAATEATLADVRTAAQLLDNIVAGTEAQVDVVTSALPTGAATETTLAAIKTAAEILDNIVSGTEAQVDVVTLPGSVQTNLDNLHSDDFDLSVGNDTTPAIGVAFPASGGATIAATASPFPAAAYLQSSQLSVGTGTASVKFVNIDTATSGNNALVAAVAAKTIRVLALQLICSASTNAVKFNDGTADLFGGTRTIPLDVTGAAGPGGLTLPFSPVGWFETAAVNRPINLNLGSANGVVGVMAYIEV